MICDTCIHKNVCYEKEEDRKALTFCADYLNQIKELEDIQKEIVAEAYYEKTFGPSESQQIVRVNKVDDIISNHISKIKGNNKKIDAAVDPYDMKYIRIEKGN